MEGEGLLKVLNQTETSTWELRRNSRILFVHKWRHASNRRTM